MRRSLSQVSDKDLMVPSSKRSQSSRQGRIAENVRRSHKYRERSESIQVLPNLVLDEPIEDLPAESFRWRVGEKEIPLPLTEMMKDPVVQIHTIFNDGHPAAKDHGDDEEKKELLELPWRIFREPLRLDLLHDYVVWQGANRRQIARAAKTRSDKRGSTRKIYQQKGTGRARMGPNRSAIRKGSGKAFGPTRRDFAQKYNKQQRRMALRVALSQKLRENRLFVVRDFIADTRSTRLLNKALLQHGWTDAVFFYDNHESSTPPGQVADMNEHFFLSARNLPTVDLRSQKNATVYTILKREHVILSRQALLNLIERIKPAQLRTWRSIDDLYNDYQLPPLVAQQARAQFTSSLHSSNHKSSIIEPLPLPPPAQ